MADRIEDIQKRIDDIDAPPWERVPLGQYENEPGAQGANGHDKVAPETVPHPSPIDWTLLTGDPPPRTWWIPDWLTPAPTICAGAGGIGKSLLLQALTTALATKRTYLGYISRPLTCLVWFCEDDRDEIWRRQTAINRYFGVSVADLGRLHIVPRMGHDNTLLDLAFGRPVFTPLLADLREQVNDLRSDVLVLDNIAQIFGGNTSDSHHVTMFVNAVQGFVPDRPFAPIFTGHVSRSHGSEFFGSVAWENACRMRWYLGAKLPDDDDDEPAEPDTVYLAKRKANYTAKDYRKLQFRGGLFVPEEAEGGGQFDPFVRNDMVEAVAMEGIRRLAEAGVIATDAANSPDYAPKQIHAKGYAAGYSQRELAGAMNRLMGTGRLKRGEIGKYANRTPRMGLIVVPL